MAEQYGESEMIRLEPIGYDEKYLKQRLTNLLYEVKKGKTLENPQTRQSIYNHVNFIVKKLNAYFVNSGRFLNITIPILFESDLKNTTNYYPLLLPKEFILLLEMCEGYDLLVEMLKEPRSEFSKIFSFYFWQEIQSYPSKFYIQTGSSQDQYFNSKGFVAQNIREITGLIYGVDGEIIEGSDTPRKVRRNKYGYFHSSFYSAAAVISTILQETGDIESIYITKIKDLVVSLLLKFTETLGSIQVRVPSFDLERMNSEDASEIMDFIPQNILRFVEGQEDNIPTGLDIYRLLTNQPNSLFSKAFKYYLWRILLDKDSMHKAIKKFIQIEPIDSREANYRFIQYSEIFPGRTKKNDEPSKDKNNLLAKRSLSAQQIEEIRTNKYSPLRNIKNSRAIEMMEYIFNMFSENNQNPFQLFISTTLAKAIRGHAPYIFPAGLEEAIAELELSDLEKRAFIYIFWNIVGDTRYTRTLATIFNDGDQEFESVWHAEVDLKSLADTSLGFEVIRALE